ncbi:MAG: helix-turn-helix transcriptional regulator [Candidatus Thermoplasmatota archaeon]|nr:helix-turn-helix transcriptional regulator [Candidatus Thermoplasmatota archaeon]
MDPGANIKRLREAANLSATAVAERSGIHLSVLSRMENGKLPVDLADYTRLLQAIEELRQEAEARWQEALAELGMGRMTESNAKEAVA